MMMSPYAMRWCRDLRISSMICSVVFGLSGFGAGARTEAATGAGWSAFSVLPSPAWTSVHPRHLRMDSPCSLDPGQGRLGSAPAWTRAIRWSSKELARSIAVGSDTMSAKSRLNMSRAAVASNSLRDNLPDIGDGLRPSRLHQSLDCCGGLRFIARA